MFYSTFGIEGVSPEQVEKVFTKLVTGEFVSMKEISQQTKLARRTVSKIRDALVANGYVAVTGFRLQRARYADNTVKKIAVFGRVEQVAQSDISRSFLVGYETFDNFGRVIQNRVVLELGYSLVNDIVDAVK